MGIVLFILMILLCDLTDCTFLPASLNSLIRQPDSQKPGIDISTEAIQKQAEAIAEQVYDMQDRPLLNNAAINSTFKMDPATLKTLETMLEHALRHVDKLITDPDIKSSYQKFIDIFPPGTIGGTLTVVFKEVIAMLWTCIKKRRAQQPLPQQG